MDKEDYTGNGLNLSKLVRNAGEDSNVFSTKSVLEAGFKSPFLFVIDKENNSFKIARIDCEWEITTTVEAGYDYLELKPKC